ncbi:MAG: hypothetical protein JW910_02715 [Anaerolineae bacterium]|nr:hypothetical protein [Anaerolineae bacterium]
MKRTLLFALLVLTLIVGVTPALADGGIRQVYDEDTDTTVPAYDDNRLNAFDFTAPVAIYAMYDTDFLGWTDDDEPIYDSTLTHFEFWGYESDMESIQKVFEVTYVDLYFGALSTGQVYEATQGSNTLRYDPATNTFMLHTPSYNYTFTLPIDL